MAPEVGLEPTTTRLTAACSTIELLWNSESGEIYRLGPLRQRIFRNAELSRTPRRTAGSLGSRDPRATGPPTRRAGRFPAGIALDSVLCGTIVRPNSLSTTP